MEHAVSSLASSSSSSSVDASDYWRELVGRLVDAFNDYCNAHPRVCCQEPTSSYRSVQPASINLNIHTRTFFRTASRLLGGSGSRVVSVLVSDAEGPGFKSQPRRCRVIVLGRLFTSIVPLFTKQQNWQQPC